MAKALQIFFTWIIVYAVVTGSLLAVAAAQIHIPLAMQTLILTAFLVPSMALVIAPATGRWAAKIIAWHRG